jgi:hypothetical protein
LTVPGHTFLIVLALLLLASAEDEQVLAAVHDLAVLPVIVLEEVNPRLVELLGSLRVE